MLPESRERGYKPGRFSFNVTGGRCEACQGDGQRRIEMNFMPDVYVQCEVCNGRRYNQETLAVKFKGHSIADVLDLTIEDALTILEDVPNVRQKLQTLVDVGLGYVHLGQSATTLSGGEAQRMKLARELSKRQTGRTLYLLDEPTTGLHFDDVRKLLEVLHRLADLGNSVIIIEHNLDVIRNADWILDLGPEGGEDGGRIVGQGRPAKIAATPGSYTGQFLTRYYASANGKLAAVKHTEDDPGIDEGHPEPGAPGLASETGVGTPGAPSFPRPSVERLGTASSAGQAQAHTPQHPRGRRSGQHPHQNHPPRPGRSRRKALRTAAEKDGPRMSTFPEQDPIDPADPTTAPREDTLTPEEVLQRVHSLFPYSLPEREQPEEAPPATEAPLFQSWSEPEPLPPPARHPNLADLLLLAVLALVGFLAAGLLTRSALYFHLWGISSVQKAVNDVHYTIGSMAVLYLVTFGLALLIFPLFWRQGLFAGLHWNARAADRRFRTLIGAACVCFLLAMADEVLLPGPANAPIDKLFETRAAAWLMFAFGVTFAPFFEESIFRGFLLPALCTAFDWCVEKAFKIAPAPLDPEGHPQWSLGAMVFASIAASIPFAWMHAPQNGYSLGPFLLLIAVSLVLCWARLMTRSLAASVLVHASYNFLLFSLMLVGTGGFRNLDRM